MGLRWALTVAAMLAVALACGGDAPAPSPTATATSPTPTPTATPTPSPTPTATPTLTATPVPTPTPEPTPTPFPTPTGPAVSVTGPLIVFSDRIGEVRWEGDDLRQVETRRVYVYDLDTDTYWAAFDYTDTYTYWAASDYTDSDAVIELAGANLIVWTEGQLRRVGLNGYIEAVLFEADGDETMEMKASPDGTKVALLYGGTLLVLDVATGGELLRVSLSERLDDWDVRQLGNWHADGNSLAVTGGRSDRTVLVSLDGAMRELPEAWCLSPDLRYALPHGHCDDSFSAQGYSEWESLGLVDIETGRLMRAVTAETGRIIVPQAWSEPDQFTYLVLNPPNVPKHSSTFREARIYLDAWQRDLESYVRRAGIETLEPRVLDIVTGESLVLTRDQWNASQLLHPHVACNYNAWGRDPELPGCLLIHGGRIVWEGGRDLRLVEMMEMGDPIMVQGIVPVPRWLSPAADAPPSRQEIVGPLLAWSVQAESEQEETDTGGRRLYEVRRVMVHDEGTGRTWQAFDYRSAQPEVRWDHTLAWVAPARNGFLVWGGINDVVRYVSLDGEDAYLSRARSTGPDNVRISPDQTKVALFMWEYGLQVFDILSGEILLDIDNTTLIQFVENTLEYNNLVEPLGITNWNDDGNALILMYGTPHGGTVLSGVLSVDGHFTLLPEEVGDFYRPSHNFRYVVSDRLTLRIWETETGQMVALLPRERVPGPEGSVYLSHWQWASDVHFAQSIYFNFDHLEFSKDRIEILGPEDSFDEISVLHVPTGEVEIMDSAEYLARFHPRPRARAECPDDRTQPCRILLDGEVVGEGLWASIIGFIPLD